MKAAYLGAQEVGFTLLSMNVSLVAVFLSILFMGGIVTNLFREFSITLSAAIIVSLIVSLTLTPMLCARWLKPHVKERQTGLQRWSQKVNDRMVAGYATSLDCVAPSAPDLAQPVGHRGREYRAVRGGAQNLHAPAGHRPVDRFCARRRWPVVQRDAAEDGDLSPGGAQDPAVLSVAGFIGGNQGTNNAVMLVRLKPLGERKISAQAVIERLRKEVPVPGGRLFLMADQDLQFGGGRDQTSAQYSYILQSGDLAALRLWYPKVVAAMRELPELTAIDAREAAARPR